MDIDMKAVEDKLDSIQKGLETVKTLEADVEAVKKSVDESKKVSESVEALGKSIQDIVKEVSEMKTLGIITPERQEKQKRLNKNDFWKMVVDKYKGKSPKMTNAIKEDMLKTVEESYLSDTQKAELSKAINEETDADGRYVIPIEYAGSTLNFGKKYGVVRKTATHFNMTRDRFYWPAVADLTALIKTPGTAGSDSTPVWSNVEFNTIRPEVYMYINDEWLEDVDAGNFDVLMQKADKALQAREDHIAFAADGTADAYDASHYGILHNTSVASSTLDSGEITFASVDWADLSELIEAVVDDVVEPAFVMHRSLRATLRTLADTAEYGSPFKASDTKDVDMLWGYPIYWSNVMPSTSTSGQTSTPFAFFGELSAIGFGDRRLMTVAMDKSYKFGEGQVTLRVDERCDIQCLNTNSFARLLTPAE